MDKIYKALLVDDEPLAREDLKAVLSEFSSIEIAAEADCIAVAKKTIQTLKPDIIFLDIELPGENGFDLLPYISPSTKIIFVTAFDEYAIRAFEVNALDYVLKPASTERIALALQRLENLNNDVQLLNRPLAYDDIIFLKLNNAYTFLKIKNIVLIEAADDYTMIYTKNGDQTLALKSMNEWETRLPASSFCRIHRSSIINLEAVKKIESWYNHSYLVQLDGIEKPATMSRRYFSKVKNILG